MTTLETFLRDLNYHHYLSGLHGMQKFAEDKKDESEDDDDDVLWPGGVPWYIRIPGIVAGMRAGGSLVGDIGLVLDVLRHRGGVEAIADQGPSPFAGRLIGTLLGVTAGGVLANSALNRMANIRVKKDKKKKNED